MLAATAASKSSSAGGSVGSPPLARIQPRIAADNRHRVVAATSSGLS